MISKINFTGKVFVTPNAKKFSNPAELTKIQEYADKYDVDVFVYDRTYYSDNTGSYSAVVSKNYQIWQKTFDMKHEDKSILRDIPGQVPVVSDVIGWCEGKYDLPIVTEDVFNQS